MTDAIGVPADLRDAPPSVKLVWAALDRADGPCDQQAIADDVQLPIPTVRSALYELELTGFVDDRPDPADARRREYYLIGSCRTQ